MSGRASGSLLARSGLALPALAGWIAALLLVPAPGAAVWVAAGACALALAAALRLRCRRRLGVVLVLAGAVCVAAVAVDVAVRSQGRQGAALSTGHLLTVTLTVDRVREVRSSDRTGALERRVLLRGTIDAVTSPDGATTAASVPAEAYLSGLPAAARVPGARIRLHGTLARLPPGAGAAMRIGTVRQLSIAAAAPWGARVAASLRAGLVRQASTLPGDGAALLAGLAIGDTSAVSESLDAAMKAASLSHLTAVSGANCAVVTAGVFAVAGLLRAPRLVRVASAVLALGGFVLLVTPEPSVVRAAAMALIVLVVFATGRASAGLPVLALAVLGLILVDPWLAPAAGFVLSVLATAGLLLFTRPIAALLGRALPAPLAVTLAVPIAAQLACQPVLVLLQPSVPLFGVLANLIAEPAAPVATVLGLLACLALPVAPPLGAALAALGWPAAAWIAATARVCAALPAVPWPGGWPGAVGLAALLGCAGLAVAGRVPRALRLVAVGVVLLVVLGAGGLAVGAAIGRTAAVPRDWALAACDVGQGDAIVLRGGDGAIALVDTGKEPQPLHDCLDRLGVDRIALLVLTHYDLDHVGAATSIARRVDTALVGPIDRPEAASLRQELAAGGATVREVVRGDAIGLGTDRLDVLWPPPGGGGVEPGNDQSVVLRVTGGVSAVLLGDLGESGQRALLAAGSLAPADIVKVAHHGSRDQAAETYTALGAALGIVSCGAGNDYHHPTATLLRMLRAVGTQPVRTDLQGLVIVRPGERGLALWTQQPWTAAAWTPAP